MTSKILLITLFAFMIACNRDSDQQPEDPALTEMAFDASKWQVKEGKDYPYRDLMLNDVLYSENLRALHRDELLELLGEPDRSQDGHYYYRITQKRLISWPLHTKTLVIKTTEDGAVEWMKVHE